MYRILAIGNSFSEDATYYLHQIYSAAGIENEVINLFIGGCPLEKHWLNIEEDRREYQFQRNGIKTDRYVSIGEVLAEREFQTIVTQQASGDSGWENTYEPFLGWIIAYLREQTKAEIVLHQTWAYEEKCGLANYMRYHRDQKEMMEISRSAYEKAAERYGLPLIRCGEVIQELRQTPYFYTEARRITRDGYHLNYLYGRYAAALTWARKTAGIDVRANTFCPVVDFMPYEKAEGCIIERIKETVTMVD